MIRLYRAYNAGGYWTEWTADKETALAYLHDTYGTITEMEGVGTPITTYCKDDDTGEELVLDWVEVEPTGIALANFMMEHAG